MAKVASKVKKSKSVKSSKSAKKSVKAKVKAHRPPLTPAEVKALLAENKVLGAFRNGTETGRLLVKHHPGSGGIRKIKGASVEEAAKFAAQMHADEYSYREIEAVMGLAPHNGNSAYRLRNRGVPLLRKEKRNAKKTPAAEVKPKTKAKVAPVEVVKAPVIEVPAPEAIQTPVVETPVTEVVAELTTSEAVVS